MSCNRLLGFASWLKKSEFQNPSHSLILSIRVPNLSRILEGSGMGGSKLVVFHSSIKPFVFSPTGQTQDHNINLKLWKNTYWGSEIVTTWCLSCFFSEGYYLGYLCLCITHHAYHCLFQNLWITGPLHACDVCGAIWFAESGKPTKISPFFCAKFPVHLPTLPSQPWPRESQASYFCSERYTLIRRIWKARQNFALLLHPLSCTSTISAQPAMALWITGLFILL